LPLYFSTIARLSRPDGVALNHGITTTDGDGHAPGPQFIDRLVFPGGEVPHISRVLYGIAGTGLEILDVEDLRPNYPVTLLHRVRRLEAAREEAIAAAGEEGYRIWRMYMAGMAYAFAFDRGWLLVYQTLAQKNLPGGMAQRPWTRRYQYLPAAPVQLSKGPEWQDL